MQSLRETLLCHYRYDALDRLIANEHPSAPERQRFYCKSRLATEIQGVNRYSLLQHGDQILAQQQSEGDALSTTLLATDQQRSVLQTLNANQTRRPIAYTPYGHHRPENGLLSLLGFNGERPDPVTGCYLLGNGYRAFNPVLMRFNCPDSWSPFGDGGLNSYAYCLDNPINHTDRTGHSISQPKLLGIVRKWRNITKQNLHTPKTYITNERLMSYEERMEWYLRKPLDTAEQFPITKISTTEDIAAIPTPNELSKLRRTQIETLSRRPKHLNFIFTSNKDLYVSTAGHQYLSDMTGSPELISAGELIKLNSSPKITIKNNSGHFIPDYKSLNPVRKYLNDLGVEVTTIRHW